MQNCQLKRILAGVGAVIMMPLAAQGASADDEVISTRTIVNPSSTNATSGSTGTDKMPVVSALSQDQVLSRLSGYAPIERSIERTTNYPFGEAAPLADVVEEKPRIRSEIGVSIGTGGYRSGYIASMIPLGENGMLGIAISKTDHGRNSYGYGYPYDYTPYGYESYSYGRSLSGARLGSGRSLDMSASLMFPQGADGRQCRQRSPLPDASDEGRRFYGDNSRYAATD